VREIAGRATVAGDAGFAEVRRPRVADGDSYRAMARAYVRGQRQDGWEEHDDVVERFDAAVVRHAATAAAGNSTLVVGTHGMVSTLWLAGRYQLRPGREQFWEALRFPDLIEIDLVSGAVTRPLP
jgi:broad specificity phosphatase PhoE